MLQAGPSDRSKEAMRKAAEEMFQERLKASKLRAPPVDGQLRSGAAKPRSFQPSDRDMQVVGAVIEGNKVNVLMAVSVCARALSFMLAKVRTAPVSACL
jgi:hypothetical protein